MGSWAATAFVDQVVRGAKGGASPPLPSLHHEKSLERRRLTVAGVRVAAMRGCGSGEGFGARAAWHTGAYVEEQRVLHLTWERCAALWEWTRERESGQGSVCGGPKGIIGRRAHNVLGSALVVLVAVG